MTRGAAARAVAFVLLAVLGVGCGARRESAAPPPAATAAPAGSTEPLRVVRHAYLARAVEEDWWETIHPAETGEEFLLYVQPKVLGPAEGPWTATVKAADGRVVTRAPSLRVDSATGRLTFVGRTASFPVGDYTIDLVLDPGGLTHGPTSQQFRFRVQAP
ncbi:MAG: hypothetical protein U0167_12845 [bacterium]